MLDHKTFNIRVAITIQYNTLYYNTYNTQERHFSFGPEQGYVDGMHSGAMPFQCSACGCVYRCSANFKI